MRIAYDVVTGDDSPDDPLGLLVQDDRFRGAGEKLIALPAAIEDKAMPVLLKIDGDALRADKAASSLGVGAIRRTTVRLRALRYASYLAGSLGAQVIDAVEGHDEGAWLGYTAFDPRPAVAELAQIRTAFAEMFKAQNMLPGAPWTYLVMARARPIGSFSTTPRFESVLLQVGSGEPWSGALKLSMAQQLARRWIGDAIRFRAQPGTSGSSAGSMTASRATWRRCSSRGWGSSRRTTGRRRSRGSSRCSRRRRTRRRGTRSSRRSRRRTRWRARR